MGGRSLGEDPSLQKITWNPTTQTVIYRSKRHHTTKRNFEIFKAHHFIAAVIDHLPPKGKQTVRYYGIYSNKTRGQQPLIPDRIIRPPKTDPPAEILLVPAPPKQSARDMRPLCAVTGAKLSEYHTGYRAFSRQVLETLLLDGNSNDFVFDHQMIAQALWFDFRFAEVTCPTKYSAESSSINLMRSVVYGSYGRG